MARELFTIGYQGTTIDTFIANLATNNIDCGKWNEILNRRAGKTLLEMSCFCLISVEDMQF